MLLTKLGFRKIEAIVSCLIAVIFFFAYEVALADPNVGEVLRGFIPDTKIATDKSMLFLALGIVGATVMPHNYICILPLRKLGNLIVTMMRESQSNSFHYLGFKYSINCRFCRKLFVVNFRRSIILWNQQ